MQILSNEDLRWLVSRRGDEKIMGLIRPIGPIRLIKLLL